MPSRTKQDILAEIQSLCQELEQLFVEEEQTLRLRTSARRQNTSHTPDEEDNLKGQIVVITSQHLRGKLAKVLHRRSPTDTPAPSAFWHLRILEDKSVVARKRTSFCMAASQH